MNFIDEVTLSVAAGDGGHGCCSFRRAYCEPRGGPDGGDGGDGGHVYLRASAKLNTLSMFRVQRLHRAQSGGQGMGKQRYGKKGASLILDVPVGTMVYHAETQALLGDLAHDQTQLCVAQGGRGGLGNIHFKSSTNRAPRRFTKGTQGEHRDLLLQLRLLADVGLLGLPNAGKSTFMRAVSAATPKVADYPFTTLRPQLGVVEVDCRSSWVLADMPGLVEGASQGVGLGLRFLRHLSRCRLLLHVVDAYSLFHPNFVSGSLAAIQTIRQEWIDFSAELARKPVWLILNKVDLLAEGEEETIREWIAQSYPEIERVYSISALQRQGTQSLSQAVFRALAHDERMLKD